MWLINITSWLCGFNASERHQESILCFCFLCLDRRQGKLSEFWTNRLRWWVRLLIREQWFVFCVKMTTWRGNANQLHAKTLIPTLSSLSVVTLRLSLFFRTNAHVVARVFIVFSSNHNTRSWLTRVSYGSVCNKPQPSQSHRRHSRSDRYDFTESAEDSSSQRERNDSEWFRQLLGRLSISIFCWWTPQQQRVTVSR